jgi:putative ABC transport system permease protein
LGRFIWSQVLHRRTRAATLGLGILVAAVSFTLLTAAVTTSALELKGTIAENWRAAYDILVRPQNSYTTLERSRGLVRPNYLSGIFGGITLKQWHSILRVPGVEVAAPVANIGYILLRTEIPVPLGRFDTGAGVQLYRIRGLRLANNGTSRYPAPDTYLYITARHGFTLDQGGEVRESVPGRPRGLGVCSGLYRTERSLRSPFDLANSEEIFCHSDRTPSVEPASVPPSAFAPGEFGILSRVTIPILLAAIDPRQESRLVGLDGAVVAGRFLGEAEGPRLRGVPDAGKIRVVPLLASTRTFVDETLRASIDRLDIPEGADVTGILGSSRAKRYLDRLPGAPVGSASIPLQPTYDRLVDGLSEPPRFFDITYDAYRTVSPVTYRSLTDGHLAPEQQTNRLRVWKSAFMSDSYFSIPTENDDTQFRQMTLHAGSNSITGGVADLPQLQVVGRFDPAKIRGFSSLSQVPLESYVPPQLEPADERSRNALGGRPLFPTLNVGGYVQQPPLAFTTLEAARLFRDSSFFGGGAGNAPISAIRVRVAGAAGPDSLSRERIRRVAQAISQRTHLVVDITAGSSPAPLTIQLPPGRFGQPSLLVNEGWTKKGVAVVILRAVDRKSLALFGLVLVVTGLFLMNGALATVRTRRSEIGTLLALGWSRGKIFRAVLGELALVGLIAGLVGTGIAAALVKLLDFAIPLRRTLLVAPIAMILAVLAGLLPAWRAARALPLDAVRPRVTERRPNHSVKRIGSMAISNLWRLPGRTFLAAAGLFIGVGALALLLSITLAFKGTLLGTALGAFISVQVRAVDYLGVALAVLLAAVSVADVLFLNLRERAPEMVTLRATGWHESHLARMVALEGLGIGLLGSVTGAAAGIGLSAIVGGSPGRIVLAGIIAALTGTVVALCAALLPASFVSRMTPPSVLAEE